MEMHIDHREPDWIIEDIKKTGVPVEVETLLSGDYCWSDIGIERKRMEDLLQSIYRNTLWEQLKNMCDNFSKPMLIISGILPPGEYAHKERKEAIGAISGIVLGWNIEVLRVDNDDELVEQIVSMYYKTTAPKEFRRPTRIKHYNPEEIKIDILTALPGIGPIGAKKLLEEYKTISRISSLPIEEWRRVKRINDKMSEIIYKTFQE